MKISGVYKITNTVTNDCYVGSSKDVKRRWMHHKCPSTWKKQPSNPMYLDMQKYGVDKFEFQILEEVESEQLKEHWKEYHQSDKYKEYQKEYQQSDKYKECQKKYKKQLCLYNGEILTLNALSQRFIKAGIDNQKKKKKKYLLYKDL